MSLLTKFATVGGATMASRVLGFVREMLIASILGAGPVADAFYAAFRFPNLFRRLLAEGAFNSAFIPLFAKELEAGGREAAREFAESILSVLICVLLILTVAAIIAMPFLVDTIIAARFDPNSEKFAVTVELARVMFPYLLFMSLMAMFSGILNAFRRYFLAALAPVILNIVLIACLCTAMANGHGDTGTGRLLAWGVVLAGALQLALLIWGLARLPFSLRLRLPRITASVRRLLMLAAPVALTGGITQINLLIGQNIASAQGGAIAVLSFADRIYQLPLGVIGIAIGVVLLPELSRALLKERESGDHGESDRLQNRSLEFSMVLTLPAAVGLYLLADEIVKLLFERGAFSAQTTELTAAALAMFAWGVPAFVLIKVFTPAYFAREDMRSPMWFALVNAVANIVLSLALFASFGHVAIAIGTSTGGWLNTALLVLFLVRRRQFSPEAVTIKRLVAVVAASAIMAGLIIAATGWFGPLLHAQSFLIRLVSLSSLIGVAAICYFTVLTFTGGIERRLIARVIGRFAGK